jgi:hypothetical protein
MDFSHFNPQAQVAKVVAVESRFEALAQGPQRENSLERELAKVALFRRVSSQAPALFLQVAERWVDRFEQVSSQLHPQRRYLREQQIRTRF